MARKRFTTEVEQDVFTRLKAYSALSGKAVKYLVNQILSEALPPLPVSPGSRLSESEATA